MKFKVNSKELEKTLAKVFPAVPSKTPVQILENFFVDIKDGILTVYATDMEMVMKSSLNVVSEGDFQAVIPARKLFDTVKALGDTTINFATEDNNRIKISWEKGEFVISYIRAEEFPQIPSFPTQETDENIFSFSISGTELKNAIEKTSFAISKESFRQAMMGILFEFSEEGLRFVSTDGHRLINILYKNHSVDTPVSYVVPGDAVSLLYKVLDDREVKIYFSKSHASFVLSDLELIARLIDERYPDYKSVIPLENEFTLQFNPKEFLSAVKRVMLITSDKLKRVKFNLTEGNEVLISAEDMDLGDSGKETIPATYVGDEMEIGFNASYLSDVLSHLTDEKEVVMKLHSPNKAVIIVPATEKENQELTMLLMPVRLNV